MFFDDVRSRMAIVEFQGVIEASGAYLRRGTEEKYTAANGNEVHFVRAEVSRYSHPCGNGRLEAEFFNDELAIVFLFPENADSCIEQVGRSSGISLSIPGTGSSERSSAPLTGHAEVWTARSAAGEIVVGWMDHSVLEEVRASD